MQPYCLVITIRFSRTIRTVSMRTVEWTKWAKSYIACIPTVLFFFYQTQFYDLIRCYENSVEWTNEQKRCIACSPSVLFLLSHAVLVFCFYEKKMNEREERNVIFNRLRIPWSLAVIGMRDARWDRRVASLSSAHFKSAPAVCRLLLQRSGSVGVFGGIRRYYLLE